MLILKRKIGETILIGDDITVTVNNIDRGNVSIAIGAPKAVVILRSEITGTPVRPRRDRAVSQETTES